MLIYNQYLLLCVIFVGVHSEREQPQLSSQVATNDDVDDQMIPPHHRNLTESFTSRSNETKEYLPSNNSISLTRPKRNNQIDIPNKDGFTALHVAIVNNRTNIVQLLEEHGANINVRIFNGSALLHVQAAEGDLRGVQTLLSNSRNVNIDAMNSKRMTALHLATLNNHVDVMEFLVTKGGADASARTGSGSTVLHLAAANGNLKAVQSILANCPDLQLDSKNNQGSTALHIAAEKGELQIVKSILDTGKATLVINNDKLETPLLLAERGGHSEVVKLLKNLREEATARLPEVSQNGNADEIPSLIKKGADIERRDGGITPLMQGAFNGHSEVVKRLRAAGAKVMPRTLGGQTPLMLATEAGSLDIVEFLIEEGADLNAKDNDGWSALSFAASWGQLDIVKYLLQKGAKVDDASSDGNTPLMLAAWNGHLHVVEYLVDNGAALNLKNERRETALKIAKMGRKTSVFDYLKSKGATT